MGDRIAGHDFVFGPGGRRCAMCERLYADISWATKSDVGKTPNLAHSGLLNEEELSQIHKENDRSWMAVMKVASP